jgi:hypothetical protein
MDIRSIQRPLPLPSILPSRDTGIQNIRICRPVPQTLHGPIILVQIPCPRVIQRAPDETHQAVPQATEHDSTDEPHMPPRLLHHRQSTTCPGTKAGTKGNTIPTQGLNDTVHPMIHPKIQRVSFTPVTLLANNPTSTQVLQTSASQNGTCLVHYQKTHSNLIPPMPLAPAPSVPMATQTRVITICANTDNRDEYFADSCHFRPPSWVPKRVLMLPIPKDWVALHECVEDNTNDPGHTAARPEKKTQFDVDVEICMQLEDQEVQASIKMVRSRAWIPGIYRAFRLMGKILDVA